MAAPVAAAPAVPALGAAPAGAVPVFGAAPAAAVPAFGAAPGPAHQAALGVLGAHRPAPQFPPLFGGALNPNRLPARAQPQGAGLAPRVGAAGAVPAAPAAGAVPAAPAAAAVPAAPAAAAVPAAPAAAAVPAAPAVGAVQRLAQRVLGRLPGRQAAPAAPAAAAAGAAPQGPPAAAVLANQSDGLKFPYNPPEMLTDPEPVCSDKIPEVDAAANLERLIDSKVSVVNGEKNKWFFAKDMTRETTQIFEWARDLVALLDSIFKNLLGAQNKHPLSVQEEVRLAQVATRLKNAYVLLNDPAGVQRANQLAEDASERAKEKKGEIKKNERLKAMMKGHEQWLAQPRYDGLRNAMNAVPFFFTETVWTAAEARDQVALIKVRLQESEVKKVAAFPKLKLDALKTLIDKKKDYLDLQKSGTEAFGKFSHEIYKHQQEVVKIEAELKKQDEQAERRKRWAYGYAQDV